MKYRIQVKVVNDSKWYGNAMEYNSAELARNAAIDLFNRWLSTTDWRVVHNEKGGETVDAIGP